MDPKSAVLSERTLIPLSLISTIVMAAIAISNIYSVAQSAKAESAEVKAQYSADMRALRDQLTEIEKKLSNIDGKLELFLETRKK